MTREMGSTHSRSAKEELPRGLQRFRVYFNMDARKLGNVFADVGIRPNEEFPDSLEVVPAAEVERLREALAFYAKPRAYGHGAHSIFVDDCGTAREALAEAEPDSGGAHKQKPSA